MPRGTFFCPAAERREDKRTHCVGGGCASSHGDRSFARSMSISPHCQEESGAQDKAGRMIVIVVDEHSRKRIKDSLTLIPALQQHLKQFRV